MCVLIFSVIYVWNVFHSKKKSARCDKKCVLVFTWSTRHACPILIQLELSGHIFKKSSNIKFHTNRSSGSRVAPFGHTDGRTDRRDEANSLFAILRTRLKSNMSLLWRDMPWSVSYLFRKLPLQNLFKSRLWLTVTATTSCTAVTTAPRIELDTRTCW